MTSAELLINITYMENIKAFIEISISLAPSGDHQERFLSFRGNQIGPTKKRPATKGHLRQSPRCIT